MGWDKNLREELQGISRGAVLFDEPAEAHTSLRVGGKVDAIVFPENRAALFAVLEFLRRKNLPFLPVGNWTNLIVRDGGFRGVFISLSRLRKITFVDGGGTAVVVSAGAGSSLAELVKTAAGRLLTGSEFLAGIPGSVGGAIRMNAGAYGGEIKDIIENVEIIEANGEAKILAGQQLHFAYRDFALPENALIVAGTFRLQQGNGREIEARIEEIIRTRREKHPLDFPNAGSIFKNPPDCPAGLLIAESGLKGSRSGGAEISEKHGNFIINRGAAKAADVLALIAVTRETVCKKTGRVLETEVKIVGEE